ncbi:sigma-70 family RNA polymerase sigma factor [Panacagrimonas sp.]|uniref:sigma-70 family RNA polymerase sigma factor n=1 Tax=Panacagrimonas sp. TaxID=2480088 RepID=UPI003B524B73
MADSQELTRLLHATATGDRRAFAELYRESSSHLFGLLLRMLQRRDWAEEALQDCYIKIWQKAETYDAEKGAPLTWLLSVARYRALDLLRMKRPEVEMPDGDDDFSLPPLTLHDEAEDPMARAVEGQGIARMEACLRELPKEQRDALLLAYYEGYTHQELAVRLKAPLGTVKSWVRRGLARLRDCLDE